VNDEAVDPAIPTVPVPPTLNVDVAAAVFVTLTVKVPVAVMVSLAEVAPSPVEIATLPLEIPSASFPPREMIARVVAEPDEVVEPSDSTPFEGNLAAVTEA